MHLLKYFFQQPERGKSDLLFAAIVAIISSHFFATSFESLRSLSQHESPFLELTTGSQSYFLLSGGSCVGEVTSTLDVTDAALFHSALRLRTRQSLGVVKSSTLTTTALFNPIGQLHKADIELYSPPVKGKVELRNIHPLEAKLKIAVGKKETEQDFSVQGPFTLQKLSEEKYSLQVPEEYHKFSQLMRGLSTQQSERSPFQMIPSGEKPFACNEEFQGAFEVGSLNEDIHRLLKRLPRLMNPRRE